MNYALSRLRYFNGQFLLEKDFTDQQRYHINRQELHHGLLHVWGIAEGLSVSLKEGEPAKLVVAPGAAVDASGRQILLGAAKEVGTEGVVGGQSHYVVIAFDEEESHLSEGQSVSGNTRFTQKPLIQFIAMAALTPGQIVLAKVDVAVGGALSNPDASVRTYAGVRLPGRSDAGFGLRAVPSGQGDSKLSVERYTSGDAVMSPLLTVTSAGAVGVGDTAPAQKLVVSGNVGIGYNSASQTAALAINGGVGIGTTTAPTGQLEFSNELGNKLVAWQSGANSYGLGFASSNLNVFVPADGSFSLRQGSSSGQEVFRLEANGVIRGAADDYLKAQVSLCGGGKVTWEGSGGALKWSQRFIALIMSQTTALPNGFFNIQMPAAGQAIPAPEGTRAVTANGIVLKGWESLYAVHTPGAHSNVVSLRIEVYTGKAVASSNWVLVAMANGDDRTLKLGTGAVIAPKASSFLGTTVPSGVILMWHGNPDTVPEGWAVCDGTNGTPDLRNRFIVGGGPGTNYAIAATGGLGEVTLGVDQMPTHNHAGSTGAAGRHEHWIEGTDADGLARRRRNYAGTTTVDMGFGGGHNSDPNNEMWRGSVNTDQSGDHTHSVSVGNAGGGKPHENRPPYFALLFIMKL
ncbi:hypothetical protein ACLESO_08555 [Pyxidicoccus sp. 3LG]